MKTTLIILRHEFLGLITRKAFWFGIIGVPILTGLMIAIIIGASGVATVAAIETREQTGTAPLGVVDATGKVGRALPDGGWRAYPSESSAAAALNRGDITLYFVVPADYVTSGAVRVVAPQFSLIDSASTADRFSAILKDAYVADAELLKRLAKPVVLTARTDASPARNGRGPTSVDASGFSPLAIGAAMMLMTTLLTASSFMMQTITTEKENRVIEVLMSSASPIQLLAGKILGLGLVGFAQLALWLFSTLSALNLARSVPFVSTLLGSITPATITWLAVYFVLAYFIYASLMGGLGALMPGSREAAQYTFFVIVPVLIPVYINQAIMSQPNGGIAVFLSMFPLTAPTAMVMRMTLTAVPDWQLVLTAVGMSITAVLALFASARVFRAQTLLAGSKPTIRQVFQALRG
jgi:ABC-2 type transport system permease protein